jgi:hypothetical protein
MTGFVNFFTSSLSKRGRGKLTPWISLQLAVQLKNDVVLHLCLKMLKTHTWTKTRIYRSVFFFCEAPVTDANAHIQERILIPMNARTDNLPLWAPLNNQVRLTNLEIDEVTTDVSLSMGTSPTTERKTSLNPTINSEKYEHSCQAKDLNPGGNVPL